MGWPSLASNSGGPEDVILRRGVEQRSTSVQPLLDDAIIALLTRGSWMQEALGLVVPTYQAEAEIVACLDPWIASGRVERILVVDSSSSDRTTDLAREMGAEVMVIPKAEFNHGRVRNLARQRLGTSLVAFVSQDATLKNAAMVQRLLEPLSAAGIAVAYARQIPRPDASAREVMHRHFLYPAISSVREVADLAKIGRRAHFCSNSCAIWRQSALDGVGGFPPTMFAEDAMAALALLLQGDRIAYVADAEVIHSHALSLWKQTQRYFDMGMGRHEMETRLPLLKALPSDTGEGWRYVVTLIGTLLRTAPHELPIAMVETLCKWVAFQSGSQFHRSLRVLERGRSSCKSPSRPGACA
ncbi:MAG: glycosyltransferase family 2 protein [Chlamydiia bacterium]